MFKKESYLALLKSDNTKYLSPVSFKIVPYGEDIIGCIDKDAVEFYIKFFMECNIKYTREDFVIGTVIVEKRLEIGA